MIRFVTLIAPVGAGGQSGLSLEFHSTIVAGYFPQGEKLTGSELRQRLEEGMPRYERRLMIRRGSDFASREMARLWSQLGERFDRIDSDGCYEILRSEEKLCCCELMDKRAYDR